MPIINKSNLVTDKTHLNLAPSKGDCFECSPDNFNTFFVNNSSIVIDGTPDGNKTYNMYFNKKSLSNSFYLEPTNEYEVFKVIGSLKASYTEDVYGLNFKIVSLVMSSIIPQFTKVINLCFSNGVFPHSLKVAKIIPIFKGGDKNDQNNYRPIAIQPIFSKIIEKILKSRLIDYFEQNNLFCLRQYGYIKNRSTINALINVIENIATGFDQAKQCSATCLDLTKAFDCVSHEILLSKLEYYGIRGIPLELFKSYLTDRRQTVVVNNELSAQLPMSQGVVQGSVLGAILFVIYVNDLAPNIESGVVLYADDTTIFDVADNLDDLKTISDLSFNQAQDWFRANSLKLNVGKTQKLRFNTKPNEKSHIKLLGVYIDNSLSWEYQVTMLCKKLNTITFQIRKILQIIDVSTAKILYFSNFQSVISYSILLWGSSSVASRVFISQKRVIRVLFKIPPRTSCKPLFIRERILTIPCLYIYKCLIYVKENIRQFQRMEEIHSYDTRFRSQLLVPYHRLTTSQRTIGYQGIKMFNSLKDDLKSLPTERYKIALKKILLDNAFYSIDEFVLHQQDISR